MEDEFDIKIADDILKNNPKFVKYNPEEYK